MIKNTKGFTLIELLAVIVILAIIALITTPIILNVIEQSRKDAAQDKAYGIIDAVKLSYTQAQTKEEINIPYIVSYNATDTAGTSKGLKAVGTVAVKASGENPTAGTVEIKDNGTITVTGLKFGNYTCTGDNTSKTSMNCDR